MSFSLGQYSVTRKLPVGSEGDACSSLIRAWRQGLGIAGVAHAGTLTSVMPVERDSTSVTRASFSVRGPLAAVAGHSIILQRQR